MIVDITSADALEIAPFRDLKRERARDAPMVIEGITTLERLLATGHPVQSVLTTPAALPRFADILPPAVPRYVAPAALLRQIVGYAFHRGVLALAPRLQAQLPARWHTVVVAERITDPSNVGALVRNARALGADALLIDAACGDPFGRRGIRASMGCCFDLPIVCCDLVPTLTALRQRHPNMRCVAATCHGAPTRLTDFVWPDPCAMLLGNEGYGLSAELLALADRQVQIPMALGVDSLNVAAATAILLYHRASALAALEPHPQSR